jgi:hypothetical protein
MKSTELRQLIRESINEYIRDIDEAGTKAGLQAKIEATEGAISKREKMANMEGIDEAYHEMLDKGKMKEIGNEVKALKKSLDKLKKQLDKLNSKGTKTEKPESEDKEIVDEVEIDETFPESGAQLEEKDMEENMDEMDIYEILHMQKLAGIISETEYNAKVEEVEKKALVKKELNEFDMDQFSLGSTPKASFEDKWNSVPNANKEVLKKSTGKEPILIMASSKGSNYLIAKGSDSKFYLYTYTQAEKPGEPKGPFNSEEEAKKIVK